MPAASIANGRTGDCHVPRESDVAQLTKFFTHGLGDEPTETIAASTIGANLHVCEFWLPGGCDLRCLHCYVASWQAVDRQLSADEYATLTRSLVARGLVDVVIPGMEPLVRDELWPIVAAAKAAGARSIGITTNGTMLARKVEQVIGSGLTVMNVSLDGPRAIHDRIRGDGVYDVVTRGVRDLRSRSSLRLITNTTLNALNQQHATRTASVAQDLGCTYAAFHPFEASAEVSNRALQLTPVEVAHVYRELRQAFERGETGSVVLEVEASTVAALVELHHLGGLDGLSLVGDDAAFLFLRETRGDCEFLVNLTGYPHHFIRTIRVADNGGLSSCRLMARTGWSGIGDLRTTDLPALLRDTRIVRALAQLWEEFRSSLRSVPREHVEDFLRFITAQPTA